MEQALRFNDGKPELSYVTDMKRGLEMLAVVMQQGAIKYEPGNWLKGGKPDREYLDSALRHMLAFQGGEEYDADTGCHHLAQAAWNMLALLTVNRADADLLDPEFDQDAFVRTYTESGTTGNPFKVGDKVRETGYSAGARMHGRVFAVSGNTIQFAWVRDANNDPSLNEFWPANDFEL